MSTYLDACLEATERVYPAGYGFALAYLKDDMGPDHLKALRGAAFAAVEDAARIGNEDGLAFVVAYYGAQKGETKRGWQGWLVEAAQLVLWHAMSGNGAAGLILRACGHPGY